MGENRILALLAAGDWGEDQDLIRGLMEWRFYPLLLETYRNLDESALYQSRVHGCGHIHRALFLAALIAWKEDLDQETVRQYFRAVCYHDVGRNADGYDLYHGARSALRLEALTGQRGESLLQLQAAVAAHSRPDREMECVLLSYQPADYEKTLQLAKLLKDADNLDRVRLGDLQPKFLRHPSARALADFAWRLLDRDQAWKNRGRERPAGP